MEEQQISEFGGILLFILAGIVFAGGGLFTSWLIRPKRPNPEKLTSYECGEDAIGSAWGNFNIRFYVVALIFILFEVEIVFLFPWATVFGDQELITDSDGFWAYLSIFEMVVFVGLLILGLVYAWGKGYLDWVKPSKKAYDFKGKVPQELYNKVNQRNYKSEKAA